MMTLTNLLLNALNAAVNLPDLPDFLPPVLLWIITILLTGTVLKHKSYYGIAMVLLVARATAVSSARNYPNGRMVLEIVDAEFVRVCLYVVCIILLIAELTRDRKRDSQSELLMNRVNQLETALVTAGLPIPAAWQSAPVSLSSASSTPKESSIFIFSNDFDLKPRPQAEEGDKPLINLNLKDLPPFITSLVGGAAGAVLYAVQELIYSGQPLDTNVVVRTAVAALVGYLLAYGVALYHLFQPAPSPMPFVPPFPAANTDPTRIEVIRPGSLTPATIPVPAEDAPEISNK